MSETIAVPRKWLASAFSLINEMGGEGIEIEGEADPCCLVAEMIVYFNVMASNTPATDILKRLESK
jgi:hypothetical protein